MFFANLKGFNAKKPRHHVEFFECFSIQTCRFLRSQIPISAP